MGLEPRKIDKPPTACVPFDPGLCVPCQPAAPSTQAAFFHPCLCQKGAKRPCGPSCHEAGVLQSGFGARPALLFIWGQPVPLPCSLVVELQATAQRPNKCLPPSLMWYTAPEGSMGSLLEDKINFWVMHVGRNNLNETCTLLSYKLTVTTEGKRYGHHPAQLLANLFMFCYNVHR